MPYKNNHMKWWGWGAHDKEFPIHDKPALWPYIAKNIGLPMDSPKTPPVPLSSIQLPPKKINPTVWDALNYRLAPHQLNSSDYERLIHSYGKSFRDLWRIRNGIIPAAPDCVCYPESEDDVIAILSIATQHNVVVIPFGGGSNIVGAVEARDPVGRMVITVDMSRMNKVLHVDNASLTARIQAGVMGPALEEQLNKAGVTLGHFPDSFEYSSLGGWVATRSAGMQSDKYGKIEDMVLAIRMVTPHGLVVTKPVPKASNSIDINHICIGSEGILGIITEVTVKVHPLPVCKTFYGYLFPDFERGLSAVYACERHQCMPLLSRLNDADKTALSFAYKTQESLISRVIAKVIKYYLKYIKRLDFNKVCLMIIAFEGTKRSIAQQKKKTHKIYQQFGGICLGTKPGKSFEKGKYDFPYLRDYAMNFGVTADVSETATSWGQLLPLYYKTREAILQAITETGSKAWCGCHLSHSYHTGASLYFTFGCHQQPGKELAQYDHIKNAAEKAFIEQGGCLSHHHAVGYEHMEWLVDDISSAGVHIVESLKKGLDPQCLMNPGKIISMDLKRADNPHGPKAQYKVAHCNANESFMP